MRSIPVIVEPAVRAELEKIAGDMVKQMRSLVAKRYGKLAASIDYTFDKPPKGSLTIGRVGGGGKGSLVVTIFAGDREAFYARFVEFGTRPHSLAGPGAEGDGALHPGAKAQPFFYPVFRANKKKVKPRIRAILRRALKGV
jgi:HK97 gp10 family phage protein